MVHIYIYNVNVCVVAFIIIPILVRLVVIKQK